MSLFNFPLGRFNVEHKPKRVVLAKYLLSSIILDVSLFRLGSPFSAGSPSRTCWALCAAGRRFYTLEAGLRFASTRDRKPPSPAEREP